MNVLVKHFCTKKEARSHCISQAGLSWGGQSFRFLLFVSVNSYSSNGGVVELIFTVHDFIFLSAGYSNRFVSLPCKRVSKFICDLHLKFHIFIPMVPLLVFEKGAVFSSTAEIAHVLRPPDSSRACCLAFVDFLDTPILARLTYQSVAHVITITRYFDFV